MKFKRKINSLFLIPTIIGLPIMAVSCSNSKTSAGFASESNVTYNNIWNLSNYPIFATNEQIKNSIYSMTVEELEKSINSQINNNKAIKKQMKVYCMELLWNGIRYPYKPNGEVENNIKEELKNYASLLSKFVEPDKTDGDTYKKLDDFIESFYDTKINIISFSKNSINKSMKIGKVLEDNNETLNFQIEFKIKNDEINERIISATNNKSIIYRTITTREQRQLINKYRETPIGSIIENQFNYQGSKLYYDITNKAFKTIVLKSNVRFGEKNSTLDSGFIKDVDTKRTSFTIDYKSIGNNKWNTYLIINLSNSNYFNVSSFNSNWKKYLNKQKLLNNDNMKNIEFKLDRIIFYDKNKYENN